jgi:DNA repair protein RadA/Sms
VETVVSAKIQSSLRAGGKGKVQSSGAQPISLASVSSRKTSRLSTKISELDRVLGGGIVPGQVVLMAGEPGIGKSTLLLQVADMLGNCLYVSGEESVIQIALRAKRLGIKNKTIQVLEETNIDEVIKAVGIEQAEKVRAKSSLSTSTTSATFSTLVIDSIQTMVTSDLSGMAGSVGQVRESTYRLIRLAKSENIPIFVVGHVTKKGAVAGPAVLMHLVDTVLWFEGDKNLAFRLLRAVKNRFGPTDEVGIFSMKNTGLKSINNPAKLFISGGKKRASGSVITCLMQGTRPVLVEIQALVVPTKMAFPKRIAQGIDAKRFELLLAVLSRRCGLPLYEYDCYLNVVGGVLIRQDPSSDLAVCLALASAFYNKPVDSDHFALGEVGLLAEIREVFAQERRVKEAKRLGYRKPITNKEARDLRQAIKTFIR